MLLQPTITSDLAFQVTLIAELGDDIAIAIAGEDLMTS